MHCEERDEEKINMMQLLIRSVQITPKQEPGSN